MKQQLNRIFSFLLALVFCVGLFAAWAVPTSAAETSGTCGNDLSWSFENNRLTISGSGDMTDYNQVNMPPWHEFREEILYLTLPDGLTSVGNLAFYDCVNLTAVTIPATVTDIGKMAFCQCRNITILNLNSGLQSIGRSAFEQCEKLQDLRLPDTLTNLGYHAFYHCAALQYVTVPASVTDMGDGVFAQCSGLVQAKIEAPLAAVPSWTFYGCDQLASVILCADITAIGENAFSNCEKLNIVYYTGSEENAQQIGEQIAEDVDSFGSFGVVTDTEPDEVANSDNVSTGENGETTVTNTTVTQTEDATISTSDSVTTDQDKQQSASVDVVITLFSEEGWKLLMEAVQAAQEQLREQENNGIANGGVNVDVYLSGDTDVPSEVLNAVAGSNVDMTVQGDDGSKFSVSGDTLQFSKEEEKVAFTYNTQRMENPDFSELNGVAAYTLTFSRSSNIRVEVMIRLPAEFARATATLYQVDNKKLQTVQSVVIDTMGYAHFYLANIDAEQSYRIGINIPDISPDDVIVPEELHSEYGINSNYFDVTTQYVFTGRTSSWGMSMNQVTWILFGVMGGCIVCVGVVMYIFNKRKLMKGYVPEISEEDLEE